MSLRRASLSERVFATIVLLTMGLGLLLSATYLYTSQVKPHEAMGHGLVEGVAHNYHGIRTDSRLLHVLQGSMAPVIDATQYAAFERWVGSGSTLEGYGSTVEPIVRDNCLSCHDVDGDPPLLNSFEAIEPLALGDMGVNVQSLARTTHVHLIAIPILLFVLGTFFVRTRYKEGTKAVLVCIPFLAVVLDIATWWLTKQDERAASGVVLAGALMWSSTLVLWVLTIWDVWGPLRTPKAGTP